MEVWGFDAVYLLLTKTEENRSWSFGRGDKLNKQTSQILRVLVCFSFRALMLKLNVKRTDISLYIFLDRCVYLVYNIYRQERAKGHTPDTSGPERKEPSLSLGLRWCLVEGCSLIYSRGVKRFPRWPHKPEIASSILVSATILQGGGKFSKRLISAYKPERYRTLQPCL